MKLDILAIAAHPDDVELSCSGTLLSQIAKGKKVGVVDLTRGELGTRGTPELRAEEAAAASEIMGIGIRENLGLPDGFFGPDRESLLKVVSSIRKYRPNTILANAVDDRHPDHPRGAALVKEAAFLSGLEKIQTTDGHGNPQTAWRPKRVFHFIQSSYIKPDFVCDITDYWETKKKSILAYKSQFHNPEYQSEEAETFISSPDFLQFLEARAREFGYMAGVKYAEGFTINKTPLLTDLDALQ